jgi:AcrR family transcriptional regulator
MKSPAALIPAPKRGCYDRALSRHQRQAAQQERMIAAIAELTVAGRELSVASIALHAGVGRNTFYEYFDDIENALVALNARARRELAARVEPALLFARTPLERIRAIARAWADGCSANRALTTLALRTPSVRRYASELSVLGDYVVDVLQGESDSRSALPGLADELQVAAVAAVFEAVTRITASNTADGRDLSRTLADLAFRLLR